jgi:hypothetical protein
VETFIADDGERLHLRISGSGLPLILLHGWTAAIPSGTRYWKHFSNITVSSAPMRVATAAMS